MTVNTVFMGTCDRKCGDSWSTKYDSKGGKNTRGDAAILPLLQVCTIRCVFAISSSGELIQRCCDCGLFWQFELWRNKQPQSKIRENVIQTDESFWY